MNTFYLASLFFSPLTWIAFTMGACIGSFLNVCIYRVPEKTFFKHGRSICPHCKTIIPWKYNVPILGYVVLLGKSACCRKKISVQYPLVELFTAALFVVIYWKFPFIEISGSSVFFDQSQFIRAAYAATFCCILITCSVIDLHLMIIPDVISLPMIALTPLAVIVHPDLSWKSAFMGVLLGGGILYAIAWLYWLIRKDYGLGMGDVKLLAGIGGWLGYESIFSTVLIASIIGSVVGIFFLLILKKFSLKSQIPFGPFLSLGATLHLLFGQKIMEFLAY